MQKELMMRFVLAWIMSGCLLAAGAQPKKSSLLWEISGNGLAASSYLFGTFHILCKDDFTLSDTLKKKLASTSRLYGELDMDEPGQEMQLVLKMVMKDKTLPQLLPAAEYQMVSDSFQKHTGMPLAMFANFIPFVPMSLAILNTVDCTEKVQPETEFMKLAQSQQMDILGLETIQDQVDAINSQPADSMMRQLKEMMLNFDSSRHSMRAMVEVYKGRDVDAIYGLMKSSGLGGNFETELLEKRNRRWVPLIEKAAMEKSSFFAVGAGHLGGPNGVLSLLRQKGYRLTPVQY